MSTETGHQSRGGLRRHKRLHRASNHGARAAIQAPTKRGFGGKPRRCPKCGAPTVERDGIADADDLQSVHHCGKRQRSPLEELELARLVQLQRADAMADRIDERDLNLGGRGVSISQKRCLSLDVPWEHFRTQAIYFDREEDMWPYYAERGRRR